MKSTSKTKEKNVSAGKSILAFLLVYSVLSVAAIIWNIYAGITVVIIGIIIIFILYRRRAEQIITVERLYNDYLVPGLFSSVYNDITFEAHTEVLEFVRQSGFFSGCTHIQCNEFVCGNCNDIPFMMCYVSSLKDGSAYCGRLIYTASTGSLTEIQDGFIVSKQDSHMYILNTNSSGFLLKYNGNSNFDILRNNALEELKLYKKMISDANSHK